MSQIKLATQAVVVGCGATATMDVAGEIVRRATGVKPLDLGLVGRWVGHFKEGTFTHQGIGKSEPVKGEKALGLAAHYAIGTAFAGALLVANPRWRQNPTMLPAVATGVLTTLAPWLIMQPAFGMGIAASKTPEPLTARLRSVRAHGFYGVGLYVSAMAFNKFSAVAR